VPLVLCILGLALYPGLITTRGEASAERSVAAVTEGTTGSTASAAELAER
jgi:hypothetical protein